MPIKLLNYWNIHNNESIHDDENGEYCLIDSPADSIDGDFLRFTVAVMIRCLSWGDKGMTPMAQASDYRKRADECVTIARTARTMAQRTMLLHIADTWLRLAKDADETSPAVANGKSHASPSMM